MPLAPRHIRERAEAGGGWGLGPTIRSIIEMIETGLAWHRAPPGHDVELSVATDPPKLPRARLSRVYRGLTFGTIMGRGGHVREDALKERALVLQIVTRDA